MTRLSERLRFDPRAGDVHDGPRRYLMMRPDVLMGMLAPLPADLHDRVLDALADSVTRHGADSLRAYAAQLGGDTQALLAATAEAAADLGWGRWHLTRDGDRLDLRVDNSPFASGARLAAIARCPVCAPIRGMLAALAGQVLAGPVRAREHACAAGGHAACQFSATREPARDLEPSAAP
jgi:hypothetical protein